MTDDEINRELAVASPARRRDLVLDLVRQTGTLALNVVGGQRAVLTDADFTAPTNGHREGGAEEGVAPPLFYAGAALTDVTMDRTNWCGVDLSAANLRGSRARRACFDTAMMEGAILDAADLVGASFRSTALGGASFRQALLEDADFSHAGLRFADLTDAVLEEALLDGADLWGASLDAATLERASLAGAVLKEAALKGASLRAANLSGADLERADLSGADLTDADLRGARLGGAIFRNAKLRNARLEEVDLSTCDITHAHLSNAWLQRTLLMREQIGEAVGEEQARAYREAQAAYLSLQHNFDTLGNGDASSWAYRRRRRMQKLEDREDARRNWKDGRYWQGLVSYGSYLSDESAELLCDYGESVPRVLSVMIIGHVIFAMLYGAVGGVVRLDASGGPGQVTRAPMDLLLFSFLSMVSGGEGIGLVARGAGVHLLMAAEMYLWIVMTGLLGFVLGNRINR